MLENNRDKLKQKALGRGLGSLLGNVSSLNENQVVSESSKNTNSKSASQDMAYTKPADELAAKNLVFEVSIHKLVQGAFQPRSSFDKASIEELAQSIKKNGIIQPILVRKKNKDQYEIIAGERRWRAAQLVGLHEVPVIVKDIENQQALEFGIIENIQREDLNPIEEAQAYQRLAREFNLSQQEISEKVGKERSTVTNSIRLLSLPKKIQDYIAMDSLSSGHAKLLLSLENQEQVLKLAESIIKNKLSVRAVEKYIKTLKEEKVEKNIFKSNDIKERLVKGMEENLQKKLSTKTTITYKDGKGKIEILFFNDDQLTDLINNLMK
jgi:ParB family chromosome partitioning protein